jgi:hypothetical protein
LLPPQETPDPHAPGPFAFADGERLTAILAGAGYRDIKIEKFDGFIDMGATIAEATAHSLNVGPLARAAADLDESIKAKIREVVAKDLERFQSAIGITPPAACWFVRANP